MTPTLSLGMTIGEAIDRLRAQEFERPVYLTFEGRPVVDLLVMLHGALHVVTDTEEKDKVKE